VVAVPAAGSAVALGAHVFALLRDAVLLVDATFQVVDCNPAAERLLGLRRNEILDRQPWALYGAAFTEEMYRTFAASMRETGGWKGDIRLVATGTRPERVVNSQVTAIRDDAGILVGAVGVIRDVTAERLGAQAVRELQATLQRMLEVAPVGLCLTGMDGRILRANGKLGEITGREPGSLVGAHFHDLTHPADRAGSDAELARVVAGDTPYFTQEKRYRRPTGESVWAQVTAALIRDETTGEPQYFVTAVEDVTQRRHATERLTAIASAQQAIADVELSPQKVMREICQHAQALTRADGAGVQILEDGELVVRAATGTSAHARGMRLDLDGISGIVLRTGEVMSSRDTENDPRVLVGSARAALARSVIVAPLQRGHEVFGLVTVTAVQPDRFTADDCQALALLAAPFGTAMANAWQLEETSLRAATDELTGLPNRASAMRFLGDALQRLATHGGRTAVMFMDLDGFKGVNDSHGHEAGDRVLAEVARRMRGAVRARDVAARFGGDEFLFVCDDLAQADAAETLASRLLDVVPGTYPLGDDPDGPAAVIGASIGVVVTDRFVMPETLLRAADEGMYTAKSGGGNRFEVSVIR
jgi:diguanylate cyclase (GGDEF)-like protein/PAS domain S-box-containing protein